MKLPLGKKKEDVENFAVQTMSTEAHKEYKVNTNTRSVTMAGLIALIVGFGGFIAWGVLAPLDEGVGVPGVVSIDSKRKTIQHLRGGIIKEILVKEGDIVKPNQPLIRLSDTQTASSLREIRGQYLSSLATEARLLSERQDLESVKYPTDISDKANEPDVAEMIKVQDQLFRSRRDGLVNEIKIINENISGTQEQISGLESLINGRKEQAKVINEELGSLRQLFKEGYVPRNRMFDLERSLADVHGTEGEDRASLARAKQSLGELKLRIIQRKQEYSKEVETQLTDVQKQTAVLKERLVALKDELDRTEINAPVEGIVLGLNVHTINGVIGPGEKILDIVPQNEALVVEAQVQPQDIAKIHVGLPADIHFSAFNRIKTPVIDGTVVNISADRLTDQRTGMPYYSTKIEVTKGGMAKLRELKLVVTPGMPSDIVIKGGERSVLDYLTKPLVGRITSSWKEE